ncbi:MAG TPA: hypothetical protein VF784_02980 [Anaerolineales bacterium]
MPRNTHAPRQNNLISGVLAIRKAALVLALSGLLLAGCRMQLANRLANGSNPGSTAGAQITPTDLPTVAPTSTLAPSPTATFTPTPDLAAVGLPTEAAGTDAFDFVATMCQAQWFTRSGSLPCPGDESKTDPGFVISLPGDRQGLAPGFPVLLMYPPQDTYETIFSKYPAFTVQKGDRFRAVLECRAHSFCDVEFALEYYGPNGKAGLGQWPHLFSDDPVVLDLPLDGIAGLKVQFGLSVRGLGNRIDAYGVWLFPHVFRPSQ